MSDNPNTACQHGHQRRKCPYCEIAALERQLAEAQEAQRAAAKRVVELIDERDAAIKEQDAFQQLAISFQKAKACQESHDLKRIKALMADLAAALASNAALRMGLQYIWSRTQYYKTDLDGELHRIADAALLGRKEQP